MPELQANRTVNKSSKEWSALWKKNLEDYIHKDMPDFPIETVCQQYEGWSKDMKAKQRYNFKKKVMVYEFVKKHKK
jgi:hypothetical protein